MNATFKSLSSAPAALKLAGALGLLLLSTSAPTIASPLLAAIDVRVDLGAPPPPPRREVVVERERPGPDYVWVGGYWGGSPGHYEWVPGRWDRPPHGHEHARWVAPHWERDRGGNYVMVKGEWR
jgi:hypothetical protein